jgi:hypothetical protein
MAKLALAGVLRRSTFILRPAVPAELEALTVLEMAERAAYKATLVETVPGQVMQIRARLRQLLLRVNLEAPAVALAVE